MLIFQVKFGIIMFLFLFLYVIIMRKANLFFEAEKS